MKGETVKYLCFSCELDYCFIKYSIYVHNLGMQMQLLFSIRAKRENLVKK